MKQANKKYALMQRKANEDETQMVFDIGQAAADAALQSISIKMQALPSMFRPPAMIVAMACIEAKAMAMITVWPHLAPARESVLEQRIEIETAGARRLDITAF